MKKELTIVKTYHASIDKVFEAWLTPQIITQWWGPNGVTIPMCEIDPKENGKIYIVMLAGKELGYLAGQEWPMKGHFTKITRPTFIEWKGGAVYDEDGTPNIESTNTVTLENINTITKMTFHIEVTKVTTKANDAINGMSEGWNQSLNKLENIFR